MDKTGIKLVILGVVLLAIPLVMQWWNDYRIAQYVTAFEEVVTDEKKKKETGSQKEKDALLLQENVIGIIEIESLDLKLPIFEGTGDAQLDNGIGHLTDTASLCETGNCVLAGHNGSRRGTFFTNLSQIKVGAEVTITNQDNVTRTYKVTDTFVVDPYDSKVCKESEEEILTLFTCAYHGTQRFVVRCEVVD